jgi:hypothetical protein
MAHFDTEQQEYTGISNIYQPPQVWGWSFRSAAGDSLGFKKKL